MIDRETFQRAASEETAEEELELEMSETAVDAFRLEDTAQAHGSTLDRDIYFTELFRLQHALVKLQDWVQQQQLRVVVLFEGRDSAGKGGVIKRITQRLSRQTSNPAAESSSSTANPRADATHSLS